MLPPHLSEASSSVFWQAVRRWRRQMQARRVLQQMSDERLRDIGLRREDVE
ncbi:DUF1127 domain-containing protein [Escherichia coli]|uniref:DUF1127 domain-containing protein n=1 Tax=Escherichia coli TaxID=562 RepID=UPI003522F5B4